MWHQQARMQAGTHLGGQGQRLEGRLVRVGDIEDKHGAKALGSQEQAAAAEAGAACANGLHSKGRRVTHSLCPAG